MFSRRSFLSHLLAAQSFHFGRPFSLSGLLKGLSSIFESPGEGTLDPTRWKIFGRTTHRRLKDALLIQGGFAVHEIQGPDCEFSFFARAPESAEEVQIWAGIRCRDRDSRYVFALRGGKNNDVYVARYAPNGESRFLGTAPLDFQPAPGIWYRLRAVAAGDRIRIFVEDEELPRLDVQDYAPLWTEGGVSLGGGWLPVEYRDVSIKPRESTHSFAPGGIVEKRSGPKSVGKAELRRRQRHDYRPMALGPIDQPRKEFSLNGEWLFAPDQELSSSARPQEQTLDDSSWHVMNVPNFWTPSLTWLHGETGFPELEGISSTKGISDNLWKAELRRLDSLTFNWKQTSGGWYRQYLNLGSYVAGRRFELCFDAIAKVAEVWVNGVHVGSHVGMFGQVRCDVTAQIKPGQNTIAIHVVSCLGRPSSKQVAGVAVTVDVTEDMLRSLPHGMYPEEAAGIWQPAKLVITEATWIEDVFTIPSLDRLKFEATVRSQNGNNQNLHLDYLIRSNEDGAVLFKTAAPESFEIQGNKQTLNCSTPQITPKLWSPAEPNLYSLELTLLSGERILDRRSIPFGFRTFEVRGNRLLLNGKPFWLRGANHFPHALRPNDAALARRFLQAARQGNVVATRSHTAPFTETWLQAADEVGMAVSFEGTWPWLMLTGVPPSNDLLKIWSDEFVSLIRRFRNHPSIVLWTVNNEMKFETAERNQPDQLRGKWEILSRTVQAMRNADPTRPIVCDSSYCRRSIESEYEQTIIPNGFDDGDIDDAHRYPGWYDPSFFHYFQGEFGRALAYPGRPLISQEMSTGYARNDDGHPCRFYLFKHYTPQSLVGYEAYENCDPKFFLERQAFITKEVAEAIRRTNREECCGVLHFAYLSWFEDAWNAQSLRPFNAYDALKLALQPVLVSAELFGRHFYFGSQQSIRICICNDAEDAQSLPDCELEWRIEENETAIASGSFKIGRVPYYANEWYPIRVQLPSLTSARRCNAQFLLLLHCGGRVLAENTYDIVLASPLWTALASPVQVAVLDGDRTLPTVLRNAGARSVDSFRDLNSTEIAVVANGDKLLSDPAFGEALIAHVTRGGSGIVFNGGSALAGLFPGQVHDYIVGNGEIATMRVPESPVFDGLEPLDLSWWELGSGQLPRVCRGSHQVSVEDNENGVLAEVVNTHGYLKQPPDFIRVAGSPLFEIRIGAGSLVACDLMLLEAAPYDPIAARLLANLLAYLNRQLCTTGPSKTVLGTKKLTVQPSKSKRALRTFGSVRNAAEPCLT